MAQRFPHEPSVIDELGTLTFQEMDVRSNRLAHSLADAGVKEGDGVAIMCRNHRGFIDATVAVSKLGADSLYLNTAFAAPQLTEVVKREKPAGIIYDEEFAGLLDDAGKRRKRFVAWHDEEKTDDPNLDELIEAGDDEGVVPPDREAGPSSSRAAPPARPRARRAARPSRSTRRCRSCRRSRSTRARPPTSLRRCSTPGASPTSPWA